MTYAAPQSVAIIPNGANGMAVPTRSLIEKSDSVLSPIRLILQMRNDCDNISISKRLMLTMSHLISNSSRRYRHLELATGDRSAIHRQQQP